MQSVDASNSVSRQGIENMHVEVQLMQRETELHYLRLMLEKEESQNLLLRDLIYLKEEEIKRLKEKLSKSKEKIKNKNAELENLRAELNEFSVENRLQSQVGRLAIINAITVLHNKLYSVTQSL